MNNNEKKEWKDALNSNLFSKKLIPLDDLDKNWKLFIKKEIKKEYFKEMYKNLKEEYEYCINNNINIFPAINLVFNVFKLCAPKNIKVVILGQDPYIKQVILKSQNIHMIQAMGLSFSVPKEVNIPPSLKNIYKELQNDKDIDFTIPNHGDLTKWVKNEGLFLLNCSLTVRENKSNSHINLWIPFINNVIKYISDNNDYVVFLLMGKYAQTKENLIDLNKHDIIKTAHPSPLSANKGFLNSNCFSECNKKLIKKNIVPINWNLE
jgi:uracil-DNA glycosylase